MEKNYKKMKEWVLADAILFLAEKHNVDLIVSDAQQQKIGCALANCFKGDLIAAGRELFHRVNKLRPHYSIREVDTDFDKCIYAFKNKITFATFMYHANAAGISRDEYFIIYKDDFVTINL